MRNITGTNLKLKKQQENCEATMKWGKTNFKLSFRLHFLHKLLSPIIIAFSHLHNN